MRQELKSLTCHSDLEMRLRLIPASAKVRGLTFQNTLAVLAKEKHLDEFLELFPESYSALRWYPCSIFIEHLAVAGALLAGAENIHKGMRQIGRSNATTFASSLLGKMLLRLLSRDPRRLLKQGCAGRRITTLYGRWELSFPGEGQAVMAMFDEYVWLESHFLGAAEGTFSSIGKKVSIEVELDSPFQGRHFFSWDPKA